MTGHVFIYSDIGTRTGEVSIQAVRDQLDKSATDYIIHIISRGGDVFEGYGIYNILKNTGKPIVTHIEGLCASIATLIAFAGEKIIMNRTSEFMVHPPQIKDLSGNSSEIRNVADQLDKIKDVLVDVSQRRVARNGKSIPADQLSNLYDKDTWMTSQQALEFGFVDEVVDAIKAVAKVDLTQIRMETTLLGRLKNLFNLTKFKNEFTETLADGRVIIVMSEDEDWAGKQVVLEDGSPLPAGDHPLKSGKIISVDDAGIITEVKQAEAPADKQQSEEMDNKIQELQKQLDEAIAAKSTAEAAAAEAKALATQATAKASKFENRVAAIEKQFLALQEEAGKTVGDNSQPGKGPSFKNVKNQDQQDPMGEYMLKYYKNRNLIPNEED